MSAESLDKLARMLQRSNRGAQIAENWSNNLQPTYATIEEIKDPENRGRVKVVLDETNPEVLNQQGLEQGASSQPTLTDWIEPKIPFEGLQPEALLKKRVPIEPRAGDPNRLFFGDPVFDPNEFKEAEQPANSSMTRLPVYPPGKLPAANETNVGCLVVEQQGPMKCDWLCCCLKREDGQYYWVRHMDLNHIHADQDDGRQPPDTDGDGEAPVDEGPIWDLTKPTTAKQYDQQSYNPEDAGWFGGAKGSGKGEPTGDEAFNEKVNSGDPNSGALQSLSSQAAALS